METFKRDTSRGTQAISTTVLPPLEEWLLVLIKRVAEGALFAVLHCAIQSPENLSEAYLRAARRGVVQDEKKTNRYPFVLFKCSVYDREESHPSL